MKTILATLLLSLTLCAQTGQEAMPVLAIVLMGAANPRISIAECDQYAQTDARSCKYDANAAGLKPKCVMVVYADGKGTVYCSK